jgi:hypothetical protein
MTGLLVENASSAFRVLVSGVWENGALTSGAAEALPKLIEGLGVGHSAKPMISNSRLLETNATAMLMRRYG